MSFANPSKIAISLADSGVKRRSAEARRRAGKPAAAKAGRRPLGRGTHGGARCRDPARDVAEDVSREVELIDGEAPRIRVAVATQGDLLADVGGADQVPVE